MDEATVRAYCAVLADLEDQQAGQLPIYDAAKDNYHAFPRRSPDPEVRASRGLAYVEYQQEYAVKEMYRRALADIRLILRCAGVALKD